MTPSDFDFTSNAMKLLYILLLFAPCGILNAQIVTIPDANFKIALIEEGVDTNGDGEIQVAEAEEVIDLDVSAENIGSLEGIQSFINLVILKCNANQLNTLDVTQNIVLEELICAGNPLTSLDVTQNILLKTLSCSNELTSLDVTQNLMLETLRCGSNQLQSLDLTQNTNLVTLFCYSNQLTGLDITQNINLEQLWCFDNPLNTLDLTLNSNLKRVWCSNNQLTSLNVTQNLQLESLLCHNNQLSTLDISQNLELETLECSTNEFTSLDVSPNLNLSYFYCGGNQLSTLDLRSNSNLDWLGCFDNELTSLFLNNGNNHNMSAMISFNNPDLICIQVDDETVSYPECGGLPLEGWCIDEWTFYSEKCTLGLNDSESISVSLHPNPVENVLNFSSPNHEVLLVTMYSVDGKEVGQFNSKGEGIKEIDISSFESGIYFLKLFFYGGQTVKRIIKK